MNRLTHERVNGIKTGYWSASKKEDLIKALAAYENTGIMPDEISEMKKQLMKSWIPCEERLPKEDKLVLVTTETKKGLRSVNRAYLDKSGFWHGAGSMACVIAWQPLPEPYNQMKR